MKPGFVDASPADGASDVEYTTGELCCTGVLDPTVQCELTPLPSSDLGLHHLDTQGENALISVQSSIVWY
jgi:hypothetical protein